MTERARLGFGDLLVVVGGFIVFGFSFAPFVQYDRELRAALTADMSGRFNAWSGELFMVPLTTFVIVASLLAVAAVWVRFAQRRDPQLVGFRLTVLEVGLTLFTFIVLLGMLMSDKYLFFGSSRNVELRDAVVGTHLEVGWGAVLMLIGSLIALGGAILNHVRKPPTAPPPA